jgi:hypothetical protein
MRIKEKIGDFGNKIHFIYDSDDQLIEEQTFGRGWFGLYYTKLPITTMQYQYDENGYLIETTYSSQTQIYWSMKHYYNAKGFIEKEIQNSDRGEDLINYEYNDKGHRIAEEGVLSGGHKYRNTWEVDTNGNKIPMSECHYDY